MTGPQTVAPPWLLGSEEQQARSPMAGVCPFHTGREDATGNLILLLVCPSTEALMRTGMTRQLQAHGKRMTASTACTCPACTAVVAAMAVRTASRLLPTLSAMHPLLSTCEYTRGRTKY